MENLYLIVIGLLIAVLLGRILIPNILLISLRKRLFDEPDDRKIHKKLVPRLGGVSFFPVILFTTCVCIALHFSLKLSPQEPFIVNMASELLLLVAGLTLLYIVGIADDLIGVRYRKKFFVQLLSASMFPLAGLYINNFYGLFGIYEIIPAIGVPLTILLIIFITNAINLIDGIDGLASGLSIVALAVYGGLFLWSDGWVYSLLAFICIGVLLPFFSYNVFGKVERGRKIFMGDTGSLTLGYLLGFFSVKFCMYTGDVPWDTSTDSPVLLAFSVLLVPCLDVVRVVLRRLRTGRNPFLPDKTHIHHKFLDMGFTPRTALVTIQLMSLGFFLFNVLTIPYLNNTLIFIIDVLVWTGLHVWFDKRIERRKDI